MFAKLNHLAITSDHYTLLGMFYRAVFGLKSSGDTAREIGAISVGDGYLGMTLIPRRGGRKAGLDHFGIEVEDLDKVRSKVAKKYPDIEIVKRLWRGESIAVKNGNGEENDVALCRKHREPCCGVTLAQAEAYATERQLRRPEASGTKNESERTMSRCVLV